MKIIGIDPGKSSGGIAISGAGRIELFEMKKMTEKDIATVLAGADLVGLEKVSTIHMGGKASNFSFGQNYGFLRGVMVTHGVPFVDILPATWMKHFSMKKKKGESKKDWKLRLRQLAEQFYPELKITDDTADAVLIMRYASETHI